MTRFDVGRRFVANSPLIIDSGRAPKRGRPIVRWCLALLIFTTAGLIWWSWPWYVDYFAKHKNLPPSGGAYFPQKVLFNIPRFGQSDPTWGLDSLGKTSSTLAAEGCAVASGAMVLKYYGIDTDPGRLNQFLIETEGGFNERGWIFWERAALLSDGQLEHVYEDIGSHYLIDRHLLAGEPVIAKIRYPNGITHFVVIAGKEGYDYLVVDPGGRGSKGPYPLKDFSTDVSIEGIRFFERVE